MRAIFSLKEDTEVSGPVESTIVGHIECIDQIQARLMAVIDCVATTETTGLPSAATESLARLAILSGLCDGIEIALSEEGAVARLAGASSEAIAAAVGGSGGSPPPSVMF